MALVGGKLGIGTTNPQEALHISGNLRLGGNNKSVVFEDNGEIRSLDATHRIIFDRSNSKLELLEYGDIIFSPGATGGVRTERVTFKTNGDVSINSGKLTTSGSIQSGGYVQVLNNNVVELGYGIPGKDSNAGKIGYEVFSEGLDIVGAGAVGEPRKIKLWAEGGTTINGPMQVNGGNMLELGYGVPGKEGNAGKIGYKVFSDGLDIVGAGAVGEPRKIKLWAEGGLTVNGPVAIGGEFTDISPLNLAKYNLWISKGVVTEDLALVNVASWKDEVFKEGYKLPRLSELEDFTKRNYHLPGLPSEQEVTEQGYSVHQINLALLEKVEQITLYLIQQEKEIESLKKKNAELGSLEERLKVIEQSLTKLIAK